MAAPLAEARPFPPADFERTYLKPYDNPAISPQLEAIAACAGALLARDDAGHWPVCGG